MQCTLRALDHLDRIEVVVRARSVADDDDGSLVGYGLLIVEQRAIAGGGED